MKLDYLRISITDRCDFNCVYCRPQERVKLLDHDEVLRFEQIARFVQLLVPWGLERVRITGGEPLVRRGITGLVKMVSEIDAIQDISMTTNGNSLVSHARLLKEAGLSRINVSLDSLREKAFAAITGRAQLSNVLAGIEQALLVGLVPIKTNTVVLRGVNEEDVVDIVRFSNGRGIVPRFIEYMPFNSVGETRWYVSNEETRGQIEEAFGSLVPASVPGGGPAEYLQNRSGSIVVGFISPISCPFCQSCSRLRLGADGKLKPCLVSDRSYDAKLLLESDGSEQQMKELMQQVIEYKKVRCGSSPEFENSQTVMFRVGG